MKIFDCFQFFDENMMLDLRLNILNEHVHKFIIVENSFMHSGLEKNPVFDINNFSRFKDKIIYILVDKLPLGLHDINKIEDKNTRGNRIIDNTLMIEHNQRNSISKGLHGALDDDLIIVSDVDEIPNLRTINSNSINKKLIHFKQKMYYYKLNLEYSSKPWYGSKACLKKDFILPQWLRDTKERKYPIWRLDILFSKMKYNSIQYIEDGGWHFANIKSPEEIEKKLNNFGHHLEYKESGLNLDDIKKMVSSGKAIYDYHADMRSSKWSGKENLNKISLTELPLYIQKNTNKYKEWIA
jgi:beta-1,4-mannosyl-glycoprotein beta-1,4-N-acetylglucosaminyltransferase